LLFDIVFVVVVVLVGSPLQLTKETAMACWMVFVLGVATFAPPWTMFTGLWLWMLMSRYCGCNFLWLVLSCLSAEEAHAILLTEMTILLGRRRLRNTIDRSKSWTSPDLSWSKNMSFFMTAAIACGPTKGAVEDQASEPVKWVKERDVYCVEGST